MAAQVPQGIEIGLWLFTYGLGMVLLATATIVALRKSQANARYKLRLALALVLVLAAVHLGQRSGDFSSDSSTSLLALGRTAAVLVCGSLATWLALAAVVPRQTHGAVRLITWLACNGAWMLAISSEQLHDFSTPRPFDERYSTLLDVDYKDLRVVREAQWFTDQGRPVPAYRVTPGRAEAVLSLPQDSPDCPVNAFTKWTICQSPANPASNCFGSVFTGGRNILLGNDIESILCDNHYQQVEAPCAGDLVIYRSTSDHQIVHAGVVRFAAPDLVLVQSKWGLFGSYLHQPQHQGYSQSFVYYRSPRNGHDLRSSRPATVARQRRQARAAAAPQSS